MVTRKLYDKRHGILQGPTSYDLPLICLFILSYVWQTTSGADGKIVVWDVSDSESKKVTTIEGIIPEVYDIECADLNQFVLRYKLIF